MGVRHEGLQKTTPKLKLAPEKFQLLLTEIWHCFLISNKVRYDGQRPESTTKGSKTGRIESLKKGFDFIL